MIKNAIAFLSFSVVLASCSENGGHSTVNELAPAPARQGAEAITMSSVNYQAVIASDTGADAAIGISSSERFELQWGHQ